MSLSALLVDCNVINRPGFIVTFIHINKPAFAIDIHITGVQILRCFVVEMSPAWWYHRLFDG